MAQTQRPLPEFKSPPVDEVALSVQFSPIQGWKIPQFGLFWETVKTEYPNYEVHPPITPQIEPQALAVASTPIIQIGMMDPNAVRCWFLDTARTSLLQVQPDRFVRNWRRVKGDEVYPRYKTLKPKFERDWTRFNEFLAANGLGEPQVNQCEVTYINIIEIGIGWNSIADLSKVTKLWRGRQPESFLAGPESASITAAYAMAGASGRLHVSLVHAYRGRDTKEVLQMQFAARGKPTSGSTKDVLAWMDRGRDWIVRAFADITTPAMHRIWERQV